MATTLGLCGPSELADATHPLFVPRLWQSTADGAEPQVQSAIASWVELEDKWATGLAERRDECIRAVFAEDGERFVDALEPCYYLRTLEWGALARTYPRPYSVWRQCGLDEDVEGGYAFVKNYFSQPNDEMLEELFDEVYGTNTGGPTDEADGGGGNLFDGIGKFIDAFQKL